MKAFVLVGATGDLALRMLWPSLHSLHNDGLLPPDLLLVGATRGGLDEEGFRARVAEKIPDVDPAFIARLRHAQVNATSETGWDSVRQLIGEREPTFYLSTPPDLFGPIARALAAAGLASAGAQLALEKPIGSDLQSSRQVNAMVAEAFAENRVFRVDHYLGKETVQNLLALRFGNSLFEPLWNAAAIDHVQITVAETVGIEGRWSYYDNAGALRDMVQNHMLQLLALLAMEAPQSFDPDAVRAEKIKVLRSLRPIGAGDVANKTVMGQYAAGVANSAAAPGYLEEEGARAGSTTETFAAIRADVDNWRWAGVPFYLRTGKRLQTRRTDIAIQFRPVPHNIFETVGATLQPNRLLIQLQPEETVTLHVMTKEPGLEGMKLRPLALNLSLDEAYGSYRRRIAYERLILDILKGNSTLFVHREEVEAAWEWIDGIHAGWREAGMTPRPYPAGSWGPAASIALAERHGHSWHE
jgi:glucose-6-phosphate 1-dehydrogenase